MVNLVPDHLKTKKMCKNAIKKNYLLYEDKFLINIRPKKCVAKLF